MTSLPNITPEIKQDRHRQFRDWNGELLVKVACGGWRQATRLEAALSPRPPRLVLIREMED